MKTFNFSPIANNHITELQKACMQLQEQLKVVESLVDKVREELLNEITGLQQKLNAASNGEIPADVQATIDSIRTKLEALDARNPDPVPAPAPVEPTPPTE